ncbi:MAG: hypothetical protein R6W77_13990 [Trueperaceae bacterium]
MPARSLHSEARVSATILERRGSRSLPKSRGQIAARSFFAASLAALVLTSIAMAGSVAMTLDAGPTWSRGGFDVGAPAAACTYADAGTVVDAGSSAATYACPAPELVGNGSSGRSGEQSLTP